MITRRGLERGNYDVLMVEDLAVRAIPHYDL
jgi:hypothetical protein